MKLYRLAISLTLLWWVLSGKTKPLLLVFGVFSICLVLFFVHRMIKTSDPDRQKAALSWRFIPYIFWLMAETIKSNIDIAKAIMGIGHKIKPQVFDAYAHEETETGSIAYANSITLTPGTVTVALVDGRLTVHALTEESKASLIEGNMDRHVHWAETGRPITEKVEGEL